MRRFIACSGITSTPRPVFPFRKRGALRSAFGLDDGTTNALMVGLATLTSLANLAVDAPVVCIVDDAQWLDEESAAALAVRGASCQRRTPGDGVHASQRRRTDRPVGGASATPRRALATARGLRDPCCDRTPVRRRRRRPDRGRVRRQPTRARRVRPRGPRGAARRTIGPPGPLAPRGAPRGTLPRPGTGAATAHAVAAVDAGGREPCRRGPRATGRSRARVRPGRRRTGVRREVAVDEALFPASLDPLGGVPGRGARGPPARARHAGDDDHGPTGRRSLRVASGGGGDRQGRGGRGRTRGGGGARPRQRRIRRRRGVPRPRRPARPRPGTTSRAASRRRRGAPCLGCSHPSGGARSTRRPPV